MPEKEKERNSERERERERERKRVAALPETRRPRGQALGFALGFAPVRTRVA